MAAETSPADRGIGCTSAGDDRAGYRAGGSASEPVPRSRTETACQCGHGCGWCIAPLSPIAMIDLSKVRNYYEACGYTDFRFGIDGLAAVLRQQFGGHLDEKSLFLFCGRRTTTSRLCTGPVTDMSCCTSGYPTDASNGPGQNRSFGRWIPGASVGSWRDCGLSRKLPSTKGSSKIFSDQK